MNPDQDRKLGLPKLVLIILVIAVVAGVIGWVIGRPKPTNNQTNTTEQPTSANSNAGSVKSLVSYNLPDGWKEGNCPSSETVFVTPNGTSLNCGNNPSSPVKISIDPENNTDCNQLQDVQNVRKHICSSVFINGHKTLKALTEYSKESTYNKDLAIAAYYIDTGNGVVKVEYAYESANEHQIGFDQLANSVQVKN